MRLWQKADLMDLNELRNLSEAELMRYARSAVNSARERTRELEKARLLKFSESYQATKRGGKRGKGPFTLSGKRDKVAILREYQRAVSFLNAQTSTIEGATNRKEWFQRMFGTTDMRKLKPFLEKYNKIVYGEGTSAQRFRQFIGSLGSERVMKTLWRHKRTSINNIFKDLERQDYEDKVALRQMFD